MNIEDQVCSLELSKKLKELGVKQNGLFFYNKQKFGNYLLGNSPNYFDGVGEHYSAFTTAELCEMLPNSIKVPGQEPFDNYIIFITKFYSVSEENIIMNNFIVNYECDSTEMAGENAWFRRKLTNNIYDPNLADVLAKIFIYLFEQGLLKNV